MVMFEHWSQIDAIFAAAIERPKSEQQAFVEDACGGNAKLLEDVLALLAADSMAGGFLERSPFEHAAGRLADLVTDSDTVNGDQTRAGSEPLLVDGDMVDHFRVIRLLGYGGMGEVYLARDTRLGRQVALKMIHPKRVGSAETAKRFLLEAKVTAGFNHPHIVTVYDVGEHDGLPYLAMEHLQGETLRERMRQSAVGEREAMRIGRALADALAEAHAHDVLHRDLKPANVFMAADGLLRVLDFGLAKVMEREVSAADSRGSTGSPQAEADGYGEVLSHTGIRGTPQYMAPECWQSKHVSPATDVWALGVILFELTEGSFPWVGSNILELSCHLCDPGYTPPLPVRCAQSYPELAQLIRSCLEALPQRRPTASAVSDTLAQLLEVRPASRRSGRAPFRGLMHWRERDALWFFGRDAEVSALLERLRSDPFITIAGPSGAGKSSLVQAGVIPRLHDQGLWTVIKLRPGRQPLRALAGRLLTADATTSDSAGNTAAGSEVSHDAGPRGSLSGIEGDELSIVEELCSSPARLALLLCQLAEHGRSKVLLFVDQLEELFTQGAGAESRRCFLRAVLASADDPLGPVRTVLCIREDYLGRLYRESGQHEALGRVTVLGLPGREALIETLTGPVAAAGYCWEDSGLIEEMVSSVHGEAAALPLLQFAGQALWERRDRVHQRLTRAAYEELGGVVGALARHTDGVLDGLAEEQVAVARALFLRLVNTDRSRRAVGRSELVEGLGPGAEQVLHRFIEERIIVVRKGRRASAGEAELELVHESLIETWPRLRQWIEESREDSSFLAEVTEAARLWERRGRRGDEVWRGDALRDARSAMERCRVPAPELVQEFLRTGHRAEQRRQSIRRRLVAAGMTLLVLICVVLAGLSIEAQRQRVRAELRRAEAELEGAWSAYSRGEIVEARAKLRSSFETADSLEARVLWSRLREEPLAWRMFPGEGWITAAISRDGSSVVAAAGPAIHILDSLTGADRMIEAEIDHLVRVALSADGQWIMAASYDGSAQCWDAGTASPTVMLRGGSTGANSCDLSEAGVIACVGPDDDILVQECRTSASPRRLSRDMASPLWLRLSAEGDVLASLWSDGSIVIWDLADGNQLLEVPSMTERVTQMAVDAASRSVVWAGNPNGTQVRRWGPTRESVRLPVPEGVIITCLSFTPGGAVLAVAGDDPRVWLWSTEDWQQLPTLHGHTGIGVGDVSFNSSGSVLATSGRDATVRTWRVADGDQLAVLRGHTDWVSSVMLSADGNRLVSAGNDQTVCLWDLRISPARPMTPGHEDAVSAVAFSPDGSRLATGGRDGTARIWDVQSARVLSIMRGHDGAIMELEYVPGSGRLASVGLDGTVRLWNPSSGEYEQVFLTHGGPAQDLDVSGDGSLLASASGDGTVRVIEPSGTRRRVFQRAKRVMAKVALSRDGSTVASDITGRQVQQWDIASGEVTATSPLLSSTVSGMACADEQGQRIVLALSDGTVELWDTRDSTLTHLVSLAERPSWIDVCLQQGLVAIPLSTSAVMLDLATGRMLELHGHRMDINRIRFSPDCRLAATTSYDATVRLWEVETGRPVWRTIAVMPAQGEILTHRGWERLDDGSATVGAGEEQWRRAVGERAVLAVGEASGPLLCFVGEAGVLEVWDTRQDRRVSSAALADIETVLALPQRCVVQSSEGKVVELTSTGETRTLHSDGVVAIGAAADRLAIASTDALTVSDASGGVELRLPGSEDVSAVVPVAGGVAVGRDDGSVEIMRRDAADAASVSFEDPTPRQVTALAAGPMQTMIIGTANGEVSLWSLISRRRLHRLLVHGPVRHLVISGTTLHAVSELGDVRSLELKTLVDSRCEVLQEIWGRTPVVWEQGTTSQRPPPQDHPCAEDR